MRSGERRILKNVGHIGQYRMRFDQENLLGSHAKCVAVKRSMLITRITVSRSIFIGFVASTMNRTTIQDYRVILRFGNQHCPQNYKDECRGKKKIDYMKKQNSYESVAFLTGRSESGLEQRKERSTSGLMM